MTTAIATRKIGPESAAKKPREASRRRPEPGYPRAIRIPQYATLPDLRFDSREVRVGGLIFFQEWVRRGQPIPGAFIGEEAAVLHAPEGSRLLTMLVGYCPEVAAAFAEKVEKVNAKARDLGMEGWVEGPELEITESERRTLRHYGEVMQF